MYKEAMVTEDAGVFQRGDLRARAKQYGQLPGACRRLRSLRQADFREQRHEPRIVAQRIEEGIHQQLGEAGVAQV